jgi:membrane dipeptidase
METMNRATDVAPPARRDVQPRPLYEMFGLKKNDIERADKLNEKCIFINALDSTFVPNFDEWYIAKLARSKLTAINITVNYEGWVSLEQTLLNLADLQSRIEANADKLLLCRGTDDIRKAKKSGRVAVILGFQDARPVQTDLRLLKVFHTLGLRVSGFTYNRKNYFADGCGERTDSGLSTYGVEFLEEMNRLGIVVDLTHTGRRSSLDAIELSKHPVIFSHNGVCGVYEHFRNTSDEMLKALARKGGVNCVGTFAPFLRKGGTDTGTTLEDTLNHVDYVVKLVGVDHVGVGLDSTPDTRVPAQANNMANKYPEFDWGKFEHRYAIKTIPEIQYLTHGLVKRGYSDGDIEKILGGNLMRVFSTVWG